MEPNYYTGIGSRKTPPNVLKQMEALAVRLADDGYTLRSGAAPGADTAFEYGCDDANGRKEIYLPWKMFCDNPSPLYIQHPDCFRIASEIHFAWPYLKPAVRNLMARNVHQVLGKDLNTPSDFVICWTPDGCNSFDGYTSKTGGTGLAIALASIKNIPIFNLNRGGCLEAFVEFISNVEYTNNLRSSDE